MKNGFPTISICHGYKVAMVELLVPVKSTSLQNVLNRTGNKRKMSLIVRKESSFCTYKLLLELSTGPPSSSLCRFLDLDDGAEARLFVSSSGVEHNKGWFSSSSGIASQVIFLQQKTIFSIT